MSLTDILTTPKRKRAYKLLSKATSEFGELSIDKAHSMLKKQGVYKDEKDISRFLSDVSGAKGSALMKEEGYLVNRYA